MRFELPKIEIEKFDCERIIMQSGTPNAAQLLADEMSETATGGVSVIEWFS